MSLVVHVKICGIRTLEDALMATAAGADLLGFNFYRKSPRALPVGDAATLCDALRARLGAACPLLIGLFVNENVGTIQSVLEQVGLDGAQLHGDESDEVLRELRGAGYKAIRPQSLAQALDDVMYFQPYFPANERFPSLLLDAYNPQLYGGTGEQASLDIARTVKDDVPRLMLAGGLTPQNVAKHIKAARPWGVDVASGVEMDGQPGRKDTEKVKSFIRAAKGVILL